MRCPVNAYGHTVRTLPLHRRNFGVRPGGEPMATLLPERRPHLSTVDP